MGGTLLTLWQEDTLASPTGAELRLFTCVPDNPKAIVQINHGMAEHAARYQAFAEALAEAGCGALMHDHRGHGHTRAADAALGQFASKNGWDAVLADVLAINAEIRARYSSAPIICFGHSMGAIIALNHAMRQPHTIDGLAAWNSGVDAGALLVIYRMLLKFERFFKGSDVPSRIAPKLTFDAWNKAFAPNRTEFDWLSRDEAQVDAYVADPLCGFDCTIGLWLDVTQGIAFAANDANLAQLPKALPVHLLAGADDPCSRNGKGVEAIAQRMRKAGMTEVSFTLLPETRHESLNELNRDETIADFLGWLDDTTARRG
ncbi:MAG: alpha/beta hydrolase [Ahrensia sp.]|nr:alpha/beta hydrolase [Ahrensia sp.]